MTDTKPLIIHTDYCGERYVEIAGKLIHIKMVETLYEKWIMKQRIDTDKLQKLCKKRNKEIEEALAAGSIYSVDTLFEIAQYISSHTVSESNTPSITNCKNCAAPINKDGYCEYCGTWYR